MEIKIIYCAQWNYIPYAERVSAEINNVCKNITLIPSSKGIFDILIDDNKIFSKYKSDRFPYEGEILELINKYL